MMILLAIAIVAVLAVALRPRPMTPDLRPIPVKVDKKRPRNPKAP